MNTLIEGWKKVGGAIYVAVPVLEELAYHASIAELDFREVYHQFSTYSESEARRLITNAFVRGYWAAGKKLKARYSYKTWRQYISNFRGTNETDYSRIAEDLRSNKVLPFLIEHGDPVLTRKVTLRISERKGKTTAYSSSKYVARVIDKSKRDGRLVADVFAFRREREAAKATAVIVSSSPLLAKVCHEKELFLGDNPLVLSIAALAYLLSLAPGRTSPCLVSASCCSTPGSMST